jgi:hypothetical protein
LEKEVEEYAVCYFFYSTCTANNEELLKGLKTSKQRGHAIRTVKYASNLVLLAKEETVLQGMIESLIEIGRCYGMERSVGNAQVMRISRQTSPIQMMIDQKQPKNVEYFNYLSSMIANYARCTREIKYRIAIAKAAFNSK